MATGPASDQQKKGFKGYGQFCVDLAEQLTKPHVIKLATVFEFPGAEIGRLDAQDYPAPDSVRCLKEKGIIQEESITSLTDALETNNLRGIADNIRRSFDKNVKSSQGVIDHMKFPFVSISDCKENEDDLEGLAFLNKMSAKKYKQIFKNYTLDGNPTGLEDRPPLEDRVDHLRVAMIGKTGGGKSATANSLLGGEFFYQGDSASSVTKSSGIATSEISNGRRISVIDSPWLKDTSRSDEEVMREIVRMAYLLREGVHVFLFVWNGSDCRISKDDEDFLARLKKKFKEEFTNHCLVVFSRADGSLKSKTLDTFIDEQGKHPEMKTFLDQIGWKVVALNNKAEVPAERKRNQDVMVDMIDKIISNNQGKVFTIEILQQAQNSHKKMLAKCNRYHPALVSAVIELYNSNTANYSNGGELYSKVLEILGKSKTGENSKCGKEVWLTAGGEQHILSRSDCNKQIWSIYNTLESGLLNFGSVCLASALEEFLLYPADLL